MIFILNESEQAQLNELGVADYLTSIQTELTSRLQATVDEKQVKDMVVLMREQPEDFATVVSTFNDIKSRQVAVEPPVTEVIVEP